MLLLAIPSSNQLAMQPGVATNLNINTHTHSNSLHQTQSKRETAVQCGRARKPCRRQRFRKPRQKPAQQICAKTSQSSRYIRQKGKRRWRQRKKDKQKTRQARMCVSVEWAVRSNKTPAPTNTLYFSDGGETFCAGSLSENIRVNGRKQLPKTDWTGMIVPIFVLLCT